MAELLNQDTELVMQEAFRRKAEEILYCSTDYEKDDESIKIGLEVEYSLVNRSLAQVTEETRDDVIGGLKAFTDAELGASQVELRTDPIDIKNRSGFGAVYESLSDRQRQVQESARKCGTMLLSNGSNPFIFIEAIQRTSKPKYVTVPNFYNDHRGDVQTALGSEGLDLGEAAVMSLFNSVQANIEAKSFEDAIDKTNRSLMIGPLIVALTGNSRYVEFKDSSFDDVRMMAWAISHDTRTVAEIEKGVCTRVGLPANYYGDLSDYFAEVSSYPFILDDPDHALEISIGLNWRDTRIKFIGRSAVVEFRPVSTQPTPEENAAAMAFYVGRLLWSQKNDEDLLPLSLVRENQLNAMAHGHRADLWVSHDRFAKAPATEVLPIEIERAAVGLTESGVGDTVFSEQLLSILRGNICRGTPAARLHSCISSLNGRAEELLNGFDRLKAVHY